MNSFSILLIHKEITAGANIVTELSQQFDSFDLFIAKDVAEVVKDKPPAEAVLLDFAQAGSNPVAAVASIAQVYPNIPLILLSPPETNEEQLLEALQAGANDYAILSPAGLVSLGRRLAALAKAKTVSAKSLYPPTLSEILAEHTSRLGVIQIDVDSVVKIWNIEAARLFGLPQAEAVGRGVDGLPLPASDISRLKDVLDQVRSTKEPFSITDYPLEQRRSEAGRLELNVYPVKTPTLSTDVFIICTWISAATKELAPEDQYSQDLQILLEASREYSKQLELQPTLEKMLEQVKSLFLGDNCQIYFLEKDNIHLKPKLAVGPYATAIKATPLKRTNGPISKILTRGYPAVISPRDVYPDIPFLPHEQLMCAPITAANGAIGLVAVSRRRFEFSKDDLRFFETLVQQASSAINNARLFEETRRSLTELEIVYSASAAISTQWKDQDVLTTLIRHTVEAIEISIGFIVQWQEEQNVGVVQAVWSPELKDAAHNRGDAVDLSGRDSILKMLHQQRPIFLHLSMPTLDTTEQKEMVRQGVKSKLIVPLITKGLTIGWLELCETHQERTFTAAEVRLSRTLASQIAVAMQNVHYMHQTEQALDEVTALYRVTSALTTLQDPQAIISTVLQEYLQALNLFQGSVVLFDFSSRQGVVKTHITDDSPRKPAGIRPSPSSFKVLEGYQLPLSSNPVYEKLMRTHTAFDIPNPRAAWLTTAPSFLPNLNLPPVAGWADEEAFSAVVVPIRIRSEIAGALVAENTRSPEAFSPWMISLGQAMADQMGIGLQNVQLYEAEFQRREQAETLQEVSSIVSSSLKLNEVLERVLDQLNRVVNYDSAAIHLIEGRSRRVIAGRGFSHLDKHIGLKFPIDYDSNEPGSLVINTAKPAVHANISAIFPSFKGDLHNHIKSWMGIPLIARDRVIGLITIDHSKINAYTDDDVQIALAFANQVAVALENARLYELEVRELERELQIAHQIQETLLPQSTPCIPGLDIAGKIIPARQVGGDFFHFFSTDPEQLGIAIGDVSGKGIPAALYMAAGITAIDTQVAPDVLPGELLNRLNAKLYNRLQENRMNIALQIATFASGTFNSKAERNSIKELSASAMTLTSAGMIAPIAATQHGCRMFPVGALPIGSLPGSLQNYTDDVFSVEKGTAIVFTSDGIVEAQNRAGEMFGFDRLEHTILQITHTKDAARITDYLIDTVQKFIGDAEQHDDMTVVVVVKS